jgi:hypothetical protein
MLDVALHKSGQRLKGKTSGWVHSPYRAAMAPRYRCQRIEVWSAAQRRAGTGGHCCIPTSPVGESACSTEGVLKDRARRLDKEMVERRDAANDRVSWRLSRRPGTVAGTGSGQIARLFACPNPSACPGQL